MALHDAMDVVRSLLPGSGTSPAFMKSSQARKQDFQMCMHTIIRSCPPKAALEVIRAMVEAGTVDIHEKVSLANNAGGSVPAAAHDSLTNAKKSKGAKLSAMYTSAPTATGASYALKKGFEPSNKSGFRGPVANPTDAALSHKFQRSMAKAADVALSNVAMDALTAATFCGSVLLMIYFISLGANVNTTDSNGETPLHHAVLGGFTEAIQILLRSGADVNAVDKETLTPLHAAVGARMPDIAALLLKSGADVNMAEDVTGLTPLHTAADPATMAVLLRADYYRQLGVREGLYKPSAKELVLSPQLNKRSARGWVPLFVYAGSNQPTNLKLLLAAGADPNGVSDDGETPLFAVCDTGNVNCAEILLNGGADPNIMSHSGRTPFHHAASLDKGDASTDLCNLLYRYGARATCLNASPPRRCNKCRVMFKRAQLSLAVISDAPPETDDLPPSFVKSVSEAVSIDAVHTSKKKKDKKKKKGKPKASPVARDTSSSSPPAATVPAAVDVPAAATDVLIVDDVSEGDVDDEGEEVDWDQM